MNKPFINDGNRQFINIKTGIDSRLDNPCNKRSCYLFDKQEENNCKSSIMYNACQCSIYNQRVDNQK